ncbi:glutamate--tRNA ligase family protein [Allorhodopirellula heiligendammensis]|uniref:Glutamate--tRNA ligase n=1 Tax=Allorhodopirellula heiligendammensis TaxID=2714739 RepID=A0A5C6BU59_9BACT|nr:glutamate--tRNA ligase family protein [Allorhodopirellula heiligendammensis]TWU15227.1 Glutamate--tRNA ligase [Allorhodopirellula heiligendammensis]
MTIPAIKPPVCRLAPSPTGAQHLGNARTFLLAYWSARAQNAELILRIEDIDSPRVKPWATDQVIEDLAWLGIDFDGQPIIQTQRTDRYQAVLDRMIADDRVYPCTCTRTDIESASSAPHEHSTGPPQTSTVLQATGQERTITAESTIYPGTCSGWRVGDPLPAPGTYCWRFRIVSARRCFDDLVAGRICCDLGTAIGDFPVTRKEGVAAYQLAVVVDDIDAGVSEVVRGDDLLLSTFRQLQIYEHLGVASPEFAHVPLVVGEDGRRLAKRHGDTRLAHYRKQGVAPESIVAWAARSAMSDPACLPSPEATAAWELSRWHAEMIERIDWTRLSREQVRYS